MISLGQHCNQPMVPIEMETLILRILLTTLILIVPILIGMDSHKTVFVIHLFGLASRVSLETQETMLSLRPAPIT